MALAHVVNDKVEGSFSQVRDCPVRGCTRNGTSSIHMTQAIAMDQILYAEPVHVRRPCAALELNVMCRCGPASMRRHPPPSSNAEQMTLDRRFQAQPPSAADTARWPRVSS
jgi:hypothetical protein